MALYDRAHLAQDLKHEAGMGLNVLTVFAFYLGVAIVAVGALGWIGDTILARTLG